MSKKINISIPKPCHENWEAMTPEDKGRFCSVCTKTVFDFTKASDKEIIEQLNKDKKTCGRFYNNQLNRDLIVPKQKSSYWLVTTVSLLGFLGIGNHTAHSQVKQDTIQTEPKEDLILGKVITPQKRIITGVVSDDLGSVEGANVVVKNSGKSTTTDFDGNFSIEAEIGDEIIVSYTSSIEKIVISEKKIKYNIVLKPIELGEIVIITGGIKKRTFFGRQIQKVRNWFR
ncbi:carboxypeptidase-like regulatory domain-containing protein [Flavobacterium sp. UBA7663]|uniref:carboxypeptidase-like regulatory domain-containing protein n=1 Tax=Flavobacterium sp. UBA7663 TaxID=1946557 RepID=UPI0025C1B8DA|nr:carboxypeptidase-like regulatory domain-containing protein [Flavobacterium sp. UBA7663]